MGRRPGQKNKIENTRSLRMKILTTLAEDRYFLGFAALINSVVKHGIYVDKIVVGYRGPLPKWLPNLEASENGKKIVLKSGLIIEFVVLDGNLHMVHEKPKWFKHLVTVLEPNAVEYFFFDSDIVIVNRMSFFGEWINEGVALCEDVNNSMSYDHPIRKQWIRLAEEHGLKVVNKMDRYYNSGFLGWNKKYSEFIGNWERCFQILSKKSGDMKKFRVQDRTTTVLSANQDSLNVAAMITNVPLSTIGPEAMGFSYGMNLMAHPIGKKPWDRQFISDFVLGWPPRASDIEFWENVNNGELKPFSGLLVSYKIFACKMLRAAARIYRRQFSS
jgi:hypothetical protein